MKGKHFPACLRRIVPGPGSYDTVAALENVTRRTGTQIACSAFERGAEKMSQHVSIWGVFPDQAAAGQALTLLESTGFRQSQIAIEKRFRAALAGFEWSQAIYVRLPEGIVAGFAGGGVLTALVCLIVARGIPPIFPMAALTCVGCVVGTILGAFTGMMVARYETLPGKADESDKISIGVLCFDPQSESRAKTALKEAGADIIDTQL